MKNINKTLEYIRNVKAEEIDWSKLFGSYSCGIKIGDYGLYFGDSGKIYFNIRKEDLKNKNFDNVWLILQCY